MWSILCSLFRINVILQPAEGIDLMKEFDWPDHLTTKSVKPVNQAELDDLGKTMDAVLDRHKDRICLKKQTNPDYIYF